MKSRHQDRLKLANDLLGNVRKFENTPPAPEKGKRKQKAEKEKANR